MGYCNHLGDLFLLLPCAQVAMMMATIPPEAPARIMLTAITDGTP